MIRFPSRDAPNVLILGSGSLAERCTSLLTGHGAHVETQHVRLPRDLPDDLDRYAAVVLGTERPFPPLERAIDELCRDQGVSWTAGVMLASAFRIGPTIIPDRTPCYDCWRRRLRSQVADLRSYDALYRFAETDLRSSWFDGRLDPLTNQVAALLAAEVFTLATGNVDAPPLGLGYWWTGDAVGAVLERHLFSRIGSCQECERGQHSSTSHSLEDFFTASRPSPRPSVRVNFD
jgi:bacteriocin biosynthesis cyclodehydratase domain-containing protein